MGSMDFRADQRQAQALSPRLQHAVRLLQMSSLDFAAMVRDTLGKNPFLEAEEGEDSQEGPAPDSDDLSEAALMPEDGLPALQAAEALPGDGHDDDRDLWQADGRSSLGRADDGEMSAMEMKAIETSLATVLHGQLSVLPLPPRDLLLARMMVESLDDDGYLRTPLEDLLHLADIDPPTTLQDLQIALKRVQSLEPAGVGARSVAECLQLQLPAIDCPHQRALAQAIITDHMEALAARDVNALARDLQVDVADVEQVCDRIRRLDPRPGWRHGASHVAYVVPDVIVKKIRGQWSVQLNPAVVPRVRLNRVYAELFQRHRTAQNTEMAGHLQEARWTVRNVEQRFSTIMDVANAIVRRQRHFLEFGTMAMKPLGLREIADEVGVHESTVSRVTNNKYMATPCGVFELKYFFSRAMVSANGNACSGTAIRGLIKDMIEAEQPLEPLSDAEITRQLARQGLVVARRTVTKYRQMLRIEAVERRRRHAGGVVPAGAALAPHLAAQHA
jgi:RNA polymerase sigma-54 factor